MFQFWYTLESHRKSYSDLNGDEIEKYASIYANMQMFSGNELTVLQFLENSQERNRGGVLFRYSYRLCNFIKTGPHHVCFRESFPKFLK